MGDFAPDLRFSLSSPSDTTALAASELRMEKYLSPENVEDYNKKEFWDQAFEQYKSVYDWYGNFTDFKRYFSEYMMKGSRILLVGCGNSSLGEKLLSLTPPVIS